MTIILDVKAELTVEPKSKLCITLKAITSRPENITTAKTLDIKVEKSSQKAKIQTTGRIDRATN